MKGEIRSKQRVKNQAVEKIIKAKIDIIVGFFYKVLGLNEPE